MKYINNNKIDSLDEVCALKQAYFKLSRFFIKSKSINKRVNDSSIKN